MRTRARTYRKRASRRSSVRHYRRNPAIAGFTLPPIDAVLYVGAGLVVPPIVTNMILSRLPADWRNSRAAFYGVKAASVLIPSLLVKKFVSQRAGNLMLLGGAASFAIDLIKESGLLPGLAGVGAQPMLGFYPGLSRRGGLGRYESIPVQNQPVMRTPMIGSTPDRLNPDKRF